MRYVRIFLLNLELALEHRGRSLVWFFIALCNSLFYFIFWHGAFSAQSVINTTITQSSISTYYFLLVIAGAFLVVHIEEDVAYWDIQQGGLSRYLTKPFSYYWSKFIEEIPWRIVQGVFGVVAFLFLTKVFDSLVVLEERPLFIVFTVVSFLLAYLISFTYKMIIGISTLWFTDYSGLHQLTTVLLFIFAGFVIPIEFLPGFLRNIAQILPFAYMIYYPVRAMQGLLDISAFEKILSIQFFWLIGLLFVYRFLWKRGVREFTGVGQ
jgi:ABC-2 type transport system permease protein